VLFVAIVDVEAIVNATATDAANNLIRDFFIFNLHLWFSGFRSTWRL
jgi:hypothetical protein